MTQQRFRLAVCKGSDCRSRGSEAIHAAAQRELAQSGLASRCKLERGGCYGLCSEGPNVVVRKDEGKSADPFLRDSYQLTGAPGEEHYPQMDAEKVLEVVRQHVGTGEPVVEFGSGSGVRKVG